MAQEFTKTHVRLIWVEYFVTHIGSYVSDLTLTIGMQSYTKGLGVLQIGCRSFLFVQAICWCRICSCPHTFSEIAQPCTAVSGPFTSHWCICGGHLMVRSNTCAWLQRRNISQPLLWRARIIRWLNLKSLLDTEWVTQVHHKPWFCESGWMHSSQSTA